MKTYLTILITIITGTLIAAEPLKVGDKLPEIRTEAGSLSPRVYTEAKIILITASSIRFVHHDGVSSVWIKDLPAELQQRCGFDPDAAASDQRKIEAQNREGNANAARTRIQAAQADNKITAAQWKQVESGERTTSSPSSGSAPAIREKSQIDLDIEAWAKKRFADDYHMQAYLIKEAHKSLGEFVTLRKQGVPGVPDDVMKDIASKAREKWYPDYSMIVHDTKDQADSYLKVNR